MIALILIPVALLALYVVCVAWGAKPEQSSRLPYSSNRKASR